MKPSFFVCRGTGNTKIGSPMEGNQAYLKRQKGISKRVCLKMQ